MKRFLYFPFLLMALIAMIIYAYWPEEIHQTKID